MTDFREVRIGELFKPVGGNPKFVLAYIDRNPGEYPVYSASLLKPFGHVNEHDYEGHYLSWTMNGYAGHVSELNGRFSLTRDRGLFIPLQGVCVPDLTYLRVVMEPALKAAAVGRRVDGRLNTYTKIYAETAAAIIVRLPERMPGVLDFGLMSQLGAQYRRIEAAKMEVQAVLDAMSSAALAFGSSEGAVVNLVLGGDWMQFVSAKTGWTKADFERIDTGSSEDVPVYSAASTAQAFVKPEHRGLVDASPERPIISFAANGDGSAGTNLVLHERPFYVSNDRTCLRVLHPKVDPWYVYFALRGMKVRHGFGHAFKATARNLGCVSFPVPVNGKQFDRARQQHMVAEFRVAMNAKESLQAELGALLDVHLVPA